MKMIVKMIMKMIMKMMINTNPYYMTTGTGSAESARD